MRCLGCESDQQARYTCQKCINKSLKELQKQYEQRSAKLQDLIQHLNFHRILESKNIKSIHISLKEEVERLKQKIASEGQLISSRMEELGHKRDMHIKSKNELDTYHNAFESRKSERLAYLKESCELRKNNIRDFVEEIESQRQRLILDLCTVFQIRMQTVLINGRNRIERSEFHILNVRIYDGFRLLKMEKTSLNAAFNYLFSFLKLLCKYTSMRLPLRISFFQGNPYIFCITDWLPLFVSAKHHISLFHLSLSFMCVNMAYLCWVYHVSPSGYPLLFENLYKSLQAIKSERRPRKSEVWSANILKIVATVMDYYQRYSGERIHPSVSTLMSDIFADSQDSLELFNLHSEEWDLIPSDTDQ